jgi:hypothetical protein
MSLEADIPISRRGPLDLNIEKFEKWILRNFSMSLLQLEKAYSESTQKMKGTASLIFDFGYYRE